MWGTQPLIQASQDLTLPIDIDHFVSNLPSLDEFEADNNNNKNCEHFTMTGLTPVIPNSNLIQQQQAKSEFHHKFVTIDDFNYISPYDTVSFDDLSSFSQRPSSPIRNFLPTQQTSITHEEDWGDKNKSLIDINRMDILNSILSNNNTNLSVSSVSENSNNLHMTDTESSVLSIKEFYPTQFNLNGMAHSKQDIANDEDKKVNGGKNWKTKCSVCGNQSSGYHYGSHTCEACKLFFRRTEKRIRKSGFTDCQKKNCKITSQSRKNCSQCRYKKCIAAGMSMARSRYGRHTERESSSYFPNITESLSLLIDQLKLRFRQKLVDFDSLNDQIIDFYLNSLKLLRIIENTEEYSPDLNDTMNETFTLNHLTLKIFSNSSQQVQQKIQLPGCIIVLFCFLFDIKSCNICVDNYFGQIFIDIQNCFSFIKQMILQNNEFVPMLKIGLFIKVLRILFESQPLKEDLIDKRITDLMRSEFALFKFNYNDPTTLALLFSQINHVLFKNMTENELKVFVLNRNYS